MSNLWSEILSIVYVYVYFFFASLLSLQIGASFMSKMITVNGKNIKYQIWDTAGQEKYHSLARKKIESTFHAGVTYYLKKLYNV